MSRFLFFVGVFFSLNLSAQTDQVLFVGNSMTYFNNMPELFKNIAISKGKQVEVTSHTVGGAGFVHHINDPALYQAIKAKNYKYVILQPGTSESAGASYPVSVTAGRGNTIKDSIIKYNPCAEIFLYQIPYGVPSQNDYATYFNVQTQIKDSITKMANIMQAEIIPAGEAARAHYSTSPDLSLHNSYNDVHPNLNGSYLVASSVYATIFSETSFPSSSLGGLAQATAEYYQQTSGNIVLNNSAQWLMNVFHTKADFTFNVNNQLSVFNNSSVNFNSVLWDFGDGITSTITSPSHQYAAAGTYTVTLTVYKNNCSYSISKDITVNQLTTVEAEMLKVKIYPNPTSEYVFYEVKKDVEKVEVFESSGRKIGEQKGVSFKGKLDLRHYSKGVYFVKFYFSDKNFKTIKIIKN